MKSPALATILIVLTIPAATAFAVPHAPSHEPVMIGGNGGSSATPRLAWQGGAVLSAPKVYMDYWGWNVVPNADPEGAEAYMDAFWTGVGGSDWAAIDTEYSTPVQTITNPLDQFGGARHDDSLSPPPIDNTLVQGLAPPDPIAEEAVAAEQHFGYDANGIYFLAFPHGDDIGLANGYCAYHSAMKDPQGRMFSYAVLPYVSDFPTVNNSVTTADCGVGIIADSPHPTLDAFSIVAGHEYSEAVTDPYPASGWYDNSSGEIGDICAFVFTGPGAHTEIHLRTGDFGVQSLWSNTAEDCVSTPTAAPPPPPPPAAFQSFDYLGPASVPCVNGCFTFLVPPGSTSVHVAINDVYSPHVGGFYCINGCSQKARYFCDGADIALPAGSTDVRVEVNPEGLGVNACVTKAPVAIEGAVSAAFT